MDMLDNPNQKKKRKCKTKKIEVEIDFPSKSSDIKSSSTSPSTSPNSSSPFPFEMLKELKFFDLSDLRNFAFKTLERNQLMQCRLVRNKSRKPEYQLFSEEGNRFLMGAKNNGMDGYLLTAAPFDVVKNGEFYLGKLKKPWRKKGYVLYSRGENPRNNCSTYQRKLSGDVFGSYVATNREEMMLIEIGKDKIRSCELHLHLPLLDPVTSERKRICPSHQNTGIEYLNVQDTTSSAFSGLAVKSHIPSTPSASSLSTSFSSSSSPLSHSSSSSSSSFSSDSVSASRFLSRPQQYLTIDVSATSATATPNLYTPPSSPAGVPASSCLADSAFGPSLSPAPILGPGATQGLGQAHANAALAQAPMLVPVPVPVPVPKPTMIGMPPFSPRSYGMGASLNLMHFTNRMPSAKIDGKKNMYTLDFRGRVQLLSCKNVQVVPGWNRDVTEEHVPTVLQFGKYDENTFTLDFTFPFCPLQAFAVAMGIFESS